MSNFPLKTIFMPWVAAQLRSQGFQIINIHPNPRKRKYNCYDFEETPELLAALTKITKEYNQLKHE